MDGSYTYFYTDTYYIISMAAIIMVACMKCTLIFHIPEIRMTAPWPSFALPPTSYISPKTKKDSNQMATYETVETSTHQQGDEIENFF